MESSFTIVVADTDILAKVCGTNDSNLRLIEEHLGVPVFTRGNEISVVDTNSDVCTRFKSIIDRISTEAKEGVETCSDLVHSILHDELCAMQNTVKTNFTENFIQIPCGNRRLYPKSTGQAHLINALRNFDMVFCTGPAGSGKTFLVMAEALSLLLSHKVRRLVLTRPVVEAGENLGFLPGDLEQKINPYLRPLFDVMDALLPKELVRRIAESGLVEVAPLAYMRGRTLNDSVIILDEAQNTTIEQMKMFLTRMGDGSKVFITGDITQIDLPKKTTSGLVHALELLKDIKDIAQIQMQSVDVVRNPLVKKIVQAYQHAQKV